jgi:hypothetical protein
MTTMGKAFGYLALAYQPLGILLLRLRNLIVQNRCSILLRILNQRKDNLYGYITIVSETTVRIRSNNCYQ